MQACGHALKSKKKLWGYDFQWESKNKPKLNDFLLMLEPGFLTL